MLSGCGGLVLGYLSGLTGNACFVLRQCLRCACRAQSFFAVSGRRVPCAWRAGLTALWQTFCGARCLRPAERAAANDRPDSGRQGVGREPRCQWRACLLRRALPRACRRAYTGAPVPAVAGAGAPVLGVSPRCRRGRLRGAGSRGLWRPVRLPWRRALRRPTPGR